MAIYSCIRSHITRLHPRHHQFCPGHRALHDPSRMASLPHTYSGKRQPSRVYSLYKSKCRRSRPHRHNRRYRPLLPPFTPLHPSRRPPPNPNALGHSVLPHHHPLLHPSASPLYLRGLLEPIVFFQRQRFQTDYHCVSGETRHAS